MANNSWNTQENYGYSSKSMWFDDWCSTRSCSGIEPAPSLVKAALIATADSLLLESPNTIDCGSQCDACPCRNGDCRPSRDYGWGLVNLDRLTDPAADRFLVSASPSLTLETGQSVAWTRQVGDGSEDVLIVLAWSDKADDFIDLNNDLDLLLTGPPNPPPNPGVPIWGGNNLWENVWGIDTGYSYQSWQNIGIPYHDGVNTVEAIFIPAGTLATGATLEIRVSAENTEAGSPQSFSVYAHNVELDP